jgi:hypothetical protein
MVDLATPQSRAVRPHLAVVPCGRAAKDLRGRGFGEKGKR